MSTNETIVSPYLLRPVRSYKEAMHDRAANIQCKGRHHEVDTEGSCCSVRREAENVEPST